LTATYELGLRTLSAVLKLISDSVEVYERAISEQTLQASADGVSPSEVKNDEWIRKFIWLISELVSVVIIKSVSEAIGVADLEKAYSATLQNVGQSNATRLIDVSLRLDHSGEVPIALIEKLHKELSRSPFADKILKDLIQYHFAMFDTDRRVRQRVIAVFRLPKGTSVPDTATWLQLKPE